MRHASRRQFLAASAAVLAAPAAAQTPAPATTAVALTTPLGRIVLALETARAPITAANFLTYVDRKLYDGASFYRASRPQGSVADDFGFVQGGLQNDPKKVL